ncbi:ribulose bisphosphate carboxylase small chain, chloroplastic-like [Neltuma alba]|uniref:ribulose bisphosphate carboxylase small chain, chloroplastic-like n=1 Tax=Neltuma alba TaxID=207710 RepID=UPI0010A47B73|nr:ribulose bisphosphate carboxylase small chain, chloroplastic-like isoform X1 [Prosopis alba]XP_028790857.1 ribulose bisphosphate carboxylase small chain, chloroplastic-like [Prosopis alba]
MASSVLSSAAVTTITPAQTNKVGAFTGLKAGSGLPVSKKTNTDITSIASNGGRVSCMLVWPPLGKKKFETLSYLPPLSPESLLKEVDYLLRNGWVPCLEFQVDYPFVYRDNHKSPGYYDGRYWTMWKLPMFGCTDPTQVLKELEEAKKEYPRAHVRIIGFDSFRQVQCISFIAYRPPPQ